MPITPCVDHLGNQFPSQTAMLRHWQVPKGTYEKRIRKGFSVKDALTAKPRENKNKLVTDHENNVFISVKEMCRHWGIDNGTYRQRIKSGWSQKDALTYQPHENRDKITDHLGNTYNTIQDMCDHWKISNTLYQSRIARNWSIKDALTIPVTSNDNSIIDPLGHEFDSVRSLCRYWRVERSTYQNRLLSGHTQLEALGLIPCINNQIKNVCFDDHLTILTEVKSQGSLRKNTKDYFLCTLDNHEVILCRPFIVQYMTQQYFAQLPTIADTQERR